jgi:GDPmannose 4,6-dehydratase
MQSKRNVALVTGINGQDGSYLAELLLEKGYEVHGIVRRASTFNRERIDHLFGGPQHPKANIMLHYGDLTDSSSLYHVVSDTKPTEVYHLGAQSHVGVSFSIPEFTANATGVSTVRLLEAVRKHAPEARYYQASSSEMFGLVTEVPQRETTTFHPRSPYGIAKLFAYWMTVNYREAYGIHASNGILFNHESPRRSENFVTRKITIGVAEILAGKKDRIYLGNLNAKRDWGYAKDYVEGMWRILQQDQPDDYVLATNEMHSVRDFVDEAMRLVGIELRWQGTGAEEMGVNPKDGKVLVEVDSRYFRPAEVDVLQGDYAKAKKKLGWEPKLKFKELVKIMLESDLERNGVKTAL